jgi:hypothetical protein
MNPFHLAQQELMNQLELLIQEKAERDARKEIIKAKILEKFDLCDYSTVRYQRNVKLWRMSKLKVYQELGLDHWTGDAREIRDVLFSLGVQDIETPMVKLNVFGGLRLKEKYSQRLEALPLDASHRNYNDNL